MFIGLFKEKICLNFMNQFQLYKYFYNTFFCFFFEIIITPLLIQSIRSDPIILYFKSMNKNI